MIETIAQFLEEFKVKGLTLISTKETDITHPVTIGNIYEGFTAEILNRSIFSGLNLRIVQNSFIYNDSGKISKEMDCMIVTGEGQKISFTDQFKYHIKDVIGVVQVKKQLYKDAIDDAHKNLISVIETAEPREGEAHMGRIHFDSYKGLMNKLLPYREELKKLSWREQIIYHFLLMQAFWPIRILIGYNSYKTEFALREAFVDYLEKQASLGPRPGYNPISFPDLMICGESTIVKNIGMPFCFPLNFEKDFYWDILLTTNKRPMYYLLELIWTRLCYKHKLGSKIFGDDSQYDFLHPFIECRERKISNNKYGWEYMYHPLTKKQLDITIEPEKWHPVEIDSIQETILLMLSENGRLKIDNELIEYCSLNNCSLNDLIKSWTKNKIAYHEAGEIILLLETAMIVNTPDGKVYIGENKNGRMFDWTNKKASI